jgi:hypothetical protein
MGVVDWWRCFFFFFFFVVVVWGLVGIVFPVVAGGDFWAPMFGFPTENVRSFPLIQMFEVRCFSFE